MLALGLDGLIRLARLKHSSMDVLEVLFRVVFASKADVVILARKDWACELLRLDAMPGRGVAFEICPEFCDVLAADLTASIISRLAVMVPMVLMHKTTH